MASLQDTVKKNKKALVRGPDGVLQEATPDLQELTAQAGLPVAPLDPLNAATIGANAHQQKMIGSPAQVQNAVKMAVEPSQSLSTMERERQPRTQATSSEQASIAKSKTLEDLGGLGDRVNQFIEVQKQKLVQNTAPVQQQVEAAPVGVTGLPTDPAKLTALKNDLAALQSDPSNQQLLFQISTALGRNATSPLTSSDLQNLYQNSVEALSKAGASVIQNSLQIKDLVTQPEFGYDLATLSQLMGVPQDQLANYSVKQFQDAVSNLHKREFSTADQLQQKAGSSSLGQAERQLAHQLGQEASATGVRSSEADVARLEQEIARADQVQFGGTSYSIDALLKDETISDLISSYLGSPEGSPTRKQLEASEPALTQWIKSHDVLLKDAAASMAQGLKTLDTVQQARQDVGKVTNDVGKIGSKEIDAAVLKAAVPGYGEAGVTAFDTNAIPLFQAIKSLPGPRQELFIDNLNKLAASHPEILPELAGLSSSEIGQLELDKDRSPVLDKWTHAKDFASTLDTTSANDTDTIINFFTGGQASTEEGLNKILQDNLVKARLGVAPVVDPGILDQNYDGKVDSAASLLDLMKQQTKPGTLKDALAGTTAQFQGQPLATHEPESYADQVIYKNLAAAMADGRVTDKEAKAAGFTLEDAQAIIGEKGQTEVHALNAVLTGLIKQAKNKESTAAYNSIVSDKNVAKYATNVNDYVKTVDSSTKKQKDQSGKSYTVDKKTEDALAADRDKAREYADNLQAQLDAMAPSVNKLQMQTWVKQFRDLAFNAEKLRDSYQKQREAYATSIAAFSNDASNWQGVAPLGHI